MKNDVTHNMLIYFYEKNTAYGNKISKIYVLQNLTRLLMRKNGTNVLLFTNFYFLAKLY